MSNWKKDFLTMKKEETSRKMAETRLQLLKNLIEGFINNNYKLNVLRQNSMRPRRLLWLSQTFPRSVSVSLLKL